MRGESISPGRLHITTLTWVIQVSLNPKRVFHGWVYIYIYVPGSSLNSHYFHIMGDGKLNPIVGVYIPIIRIPNKSWEVSHPQYSDF